MWHKVPTCRSLIQTSEIYRAVKEVWSIQVRHTYYIHIQQQTPEHKAQIAVEVLEKKKNPNQNPNNNNKKNQKTNKQKTPPKPKQKSDWNLFPKEAMDILNLWWIWPEEYDQTSKFDQGGWTSIGIPISLLFYSLCVSSIHLIYFREKHEKATVKTRLVSKVTA